jgi:16S rRNA processing protein RimM
MSDNLILLGVISSAYQLKGLVKISSYTSSPKDICKHVCYDKNGEEYKIAFVKDDKKKIIAKIEGVTDRTMAEKILGTKLYVSRDVLASPEESEYYISDLIGLDVIDAKDNVVGKVKAFHNFGAGDIIEIDFENKKGELFPFTEELFPEVTKEFVRMVNLDGL